jgi:hypothetical protein
MSSSLISSHLVSACHVQQGSYQFFSLPDVSMVEVLAVVTVYSGYPELYLSCKRLNMSTGGARTIVSLLLISYFLHLPVCL